MGQIHATCIGIDGVGILLRGNSASGKSDLALRLIEAGAELVADDRVDLLADSGALMASPPGPLQGLLEVRGLGILAFPWRADIRVQAIIDLGPAEKIDRLPDARTETIEGVDVACFQLDPWAPSAAIKVRLVSALVSGSIRRVDD